jgi:hypothetical protein
MNSLKRIGLILILSTALLASPALVFAGAQDGIIAQEEPPAPGPGDSPLPFEIDDDPANQVTFRSLGLDHDNVLTSPFDEYILDFSLPAEWSLQSQAVLQLDISTVVSSVVLAQGFATDVSGMIAGAVIVRLNGVALETNILLGNHDHSLFYYAVPDEALVLDPLIGMHELSIQWDATSSCDSNLAATLIVHPSSLLILPHQTSPLALDLALFPDPLFRENSPSQGEVVVVVPDAASAEELQAAMAVSAGLGKLSGGELDVSLLPAGELSGQAQESGHLVFVGVDDSFALLDQVNLPVFTTSTGSDGLIRIALSPWNEARVVLSLSGGDGGAVLKAARALSSGELVTVNSGRTAAIVSDVGMADLEAGFAEDMTFGALSGEELNFQKFGTNKKYIPFTIPPGLSIGAEAYLDLYYNHSQLIDYLRSGIVLRINNVPVGSARLGDTTANYSQVRLLIPNTALKAGMNLLEIQVDLVPRNICTDVRHESLWVTVFPESLLHLPVTELGFVEAGALGDYPLPFAGNEELSDTLLVVPGDSPAAWGAAARLAFNLGSLTGGRVSSPQLVFSASFSLADAAGRNVIVIGQPGEMPFLDELNSIMPVSIGADGELMPEGGAMVEYDISTDASVGYLVLVQSPLEQEKAVLALLGSTDEGVHWAVDVIVNEGARSKMEKGNFALVQGRRVIVEDFRQLVAEVEVFVPVIPGEEVEPGEEEGELTEEGVVPGAVEYAPEPWVMPALVGAVLVSLIILGFQLYQFIQKRKY